MATIYDVIQGINQAAANATDGAHDERYSYDGKERKRGRYSRSRRSIRSGRASKVFPLSVTVGIAHPPDD